MNISSQALHDPAWPTIVRDALRQYDVAPELLTLETTENAIMADPERALQALETLSRLGVRLAIDDFGTGYSSLGYLKRLCVDELKLDTSFNARLGADAENAAIVCAIIGMAHALKLEVVAEGVEDRTAYDLLTAVGCDRAHGLHGSRPPQSQSPAAGGEGL